MGLLDKAKDEMADTKEDMKTMEEKMAERKRMEEQQAQTDQPQ